MPTVKQAAKTERTAFYTPWFGGLLYPSPKRLGFQCNTSIMKRSNKDQFLSDLAAADCASLDVETSSLKWADPSTEVISVNIGFPGNKNYVGFLRQEGYFNAQQQSLLLSRDEIIGLIGRVLSKNKVFTWHRFFDQHMLCYRLGFPPEAFHNVHDGLILFWGLDSNMKSGLSLKAFAETYLGIENYSLEDSAWEDIYLMDPRTLIQYGGLDAYATVEAGQLLYGIYERKYPVMLRLFLENANALYDIQEVPQVLDTSYLSSLVKKVESELDHVRSEFFSKYGTINLNSNQQKSSLLFKLGFDTGERNQPKKDGTIIQSVSAENLAKLVSAPGGCPPASLMLRNASLDKLLNSYLIPMYNSALASSEVPVRFHIKDHDVVTLRYSAGQYRIKHKPYFYLPISMQTLPKPHKGLRELNYDPSTFAFEWCPSGVQGNYCVESSTDQFNVRKAILGGEGGYVVKADFASQELIIPMNLSGEETWLNAVKNNADLHRATMEKALGRAVTSEERQKGKACNFGLMYEIHRPEFVLANQFKWPIEEALAFFNTYKSALPRLYAWKDRVIADAKVSGSVRIPGYGFERRLYSYFHSANRKIREFAERTAVNEWVQGYAGLMMRVLMTKLWKWCMVPGGPFHGSGVKPITTVHDEIDIFVPRADLLSSVIPAFKSLMESVTPDGWEVPLKVEVELGRNMGETFVIHQDASGLWVPKEEKRKESLPVEESAAPLVFEPESDLEGFDL